MASDAAARLGALNQARLGQHVEVLHDGGQRHRERSSELAHRQLRLLVETRQQGTARRIGKGREGAIERGILIVNHSVN